MTTTDNSRRAIIALHPILPGAIAYINAERAVTPVGQQVIEDWLEQGLKVAKVTLAEAMAQLSLHNATQEALAIDLREHYAVGREEDWVENAMSQRATPFPHSKIMIGFNPSTEDLPVFLRKQAD